MHEFFSLETTLRVFKFLSAIDSKFTLVAVIELNVRLILSDVVTSALS